MRRAVFRTGVRRPVARLRRVGRLYGLAYLVGCGAGGALVFALPTAVVQAAGAAIRARLAGGAGLPLALWSQRAYSDAVIGLASVALIWIFAQTSVARLALPAVLSGWGALAGLGSVMLVMALGPRGIWIDLLAVLPWNILAAGGLSAAAIHAHVHLPGWQGQVDSAARARALAQVTMVCTLVVWLIVLDGWAQARLSPVWLQTFGLVG